MMLMSCPTREPMLKKSSAQSEQWLVECIAIIVAFNTNGEAFSSHFLDENSVKLYRFCCKAMKQERRQTNEINFPHYRVISTASSGVAAATYFFTICSLIFSDM